MLFSLTKTLPSIDFIFMGFKKKKKSYFPTQNSDSRCKVLVLQRARCKIAVFPNAFFFHTSGVKNLEDMA